MEFSPTDLVFLNEVRVCFLASFSVNSRIGLVPLCFVAEADRLYVTTEPTTNKIRNLRRNPNATVLIQYYSEDWSQVKYLMILAKAHVVEDATEYGRAKSLLDNRYPQFETDFPIRPDKTAVIRIMPTQINRWGFEQKSGN